MAELPIIMRFRDEASRAIQGVGRDLQGLEQSASRAGVQTAALQQRSGLLAQEMSRLGKEVAQGKISVDQADTEYKKFESTLARVEVQAEQTQGVFGRMRAGVSQAGQAWAQIATPIQSTIAILQQVGQVAQQAYQFVGEGVQMTLAEGRFDALTRSVGTTSDALMGELRTATRGTVSDFKLMEGASQLLNLGLTKTQEETVRLGSVAGKLGWDMNVLGLTIANQSTMRLDSLGLSMEDVKNRAEALRKQGMATDQAFKFAIIEAGEAKLELLGDAADTAAGKLLILETNAANVGDKFKSTFSEQIISNINEVAGGIFETQEGASRLGEVLALMLSGAIVPTRENSEKLAMALVGVNTAFGEVKNITASTTTGLRMNKTALEEERRAVVASMTAYDDRGEAIAEHNRVLIEANTLLSHEAGILYNQTSPAYAEFQDKLTQTTYHLSENEAMVAQANARMVAWGETIPPVTGAIYATSEAVAAYNARLGDHAVMAMNAGEGGVNLNQVVLDSIDKFGGGAEAIIGYALATGQLTEAQAENMLKQAAMIEYAEQLGAQLAAKTITINDAVAALTTFEAGLSTSNIMVNTATGSVQLLDESLVGAGSSVGSLQAGFGDFSTAGAVSATQDFIDRLNSIPRTVDVQVNVHGGEGVTAPGGHQEGFSRGGRVRGGVPGRDSVPAMLMPDEEVLTVAEARRYRQWRQAGALSAVSRPQPFQASGATDTASGGGGGGTTIHAPINITVATPVGTDRGAAAQVGQIIAREVTAQLSKLGVKASSRATMNV